MRSAFFISMQFELKVIDGATAFFKRISKNANTAVERLQFMKYKILFGERESDIYVASYLKSGTTWMQMILYQLTTSGDVNFEHIYDVSPWLHNLAVTEGKIPELPSPRIIKTHDPYDKIEKEQKGRYIFLLRDGRDIAFSLFHHQKNYNDSAITFEKNYEVSFVEGNEMNWFKYTQAWLQNKKKLPVLYVKYEDLQTNFVGELYRIADYLGITVKEKDIPRIVERCSFTFMKQHQEKFGEQPPKRSHQIVYNQFIREGKVGEGNKVIDDKTLCHFFENFQNTLGAFPVMDSYKKSLEKEMGKRFPPPFFFEQ